MSRNVYGWSTRGRKNRKRNRAHDWSINRQPPIFALFGRVALHISWYNVANTIGPQLSLLACLKLTSFSSHLRFTRFRDLSSIRILPKIGVSCSSLFS